MHKHNALIPFAVSSLLAASSLVACNPSELIPVDLASMENLSVRFDVPQDTGPRSFEAILDPGATDVDCRLIHATATLDGVPLPLVEPGSIQPYMFFGTMCSLPRFGVSDWSGPTPDAGGISTLEIRDESKTIVVAIRNLGVARTLSIVSPAGGVIAAGDHVVLAWSPSTDVLDPATTEVRAGGIALSAAQVTISGANIGFDMPAGAQAGTLDVMTSTASIARCDGAASCFDYSVLGASATFQLAP